MSTRGSQRVRFGDSLYGVAAEHAKTANDSPFMRSLREQRVVLSEFYDYVAFMYPVVFTFNRALIRSLTKVDNVMSSHLVARLAEQLLEEQRHNSLYRRMLSCYSIDHKLIYFEYVRDEARANWRALADPKVNEVDLDVHTRFGRFPLVVFSLCELLLSSATDTSVSFWDYYSCQSAIEALLFEVVSESILPAVASHPVLGGDVATAWWREHARHPSTGGMNDEEKHLAVARTMLNRNLREPIDQKRALTHATTVMKLLAATTYCVR